MSSELGAIFVPNHPPSYGELVAQCERGELSLAWVPPIATAKLEASGKVSVLALPVRRGAVTYRASIVTHKDGPSSLADLRGTLMGWVDRESCSGFVVPRLLLLASSLNLKNFFSREIFLGSHGAVVDAVLAKRVQVGATFYSVDQPSPDVRAKPQPTSLRVLAASGPIPNDALVVSSEMPIEMRSKLLRFFLDFRTEDVRKLCLSLFGAGGFRVASPEHFAALQQMMRSARAQGEIT
jgi:phosphonate transport system substrate-binding protein